MGVDVPEACVLYHTKSYETMEHIYNNIYTSKRLNEKYPRLSELWYQWDGKTDDLGDKGSVTDELKEYFTIKDSQWPTEPEKSEWLPVGWNSAGLSRRLQYMVWTAEKEVMSVFCSAAF